MDPYLELTGLWPQAHTALMVAMQGHLAPLVRPRYRVAIDERIYVNIEYGEKSTHSLAGIPDVVISESNFSKDALRESAAAYSAAHLLTVDIDQPNEIYEIKERYLEVREVSTRRVVTAIELLSPTNKLSGEGREKYLSKRAKVFSSQTHFIEIDLIRAGDRMPFKIRDGKLLDYYILVSRAAHRPRADAHTFSLRQPIPPFPIPLLDGDPEPAIPLNQLLHDLYDRMGYDLAIDYHQPCAPPLSPEDAAWAATLSQPSQTPSS